MAVRKATKKKTAKKTVAKKARKAPAKKKKAPAKKAPAKKTKRSSGRSGSGTAPASGGNPAGLRVRMYRVGFGDFFLFTVPAASGPKHILIDCGVHSKDTHSIQAAVSHMAAETGKQLALIIVTHRHADHVTGFSKCKDVFKDFKVERIWMSWYENPKDAKALAIQANIAAVATQVSHALAARDKPEDEQYRNMVGNITEAMSATGTQNPGAFEVLRGFPGNPPISYYKAGDTPELPQDLVDAGLDAQILGPPDSNNMIKKTDSSKEEYLASEAATEGGHIRLFSPPFWVQPGEYSSDVLSKEDILAMQTRVATVQPDTLAARAGVANNLINNQSLVTLFTFKDKTLLFAGDAQWGNWANFLFGSLTGTTLKAASKAILGNLDFYKVGHHGSTNATPKDALAAMKDGCVAMCSTAIGAYNEVPRDALITAIDQKTHHQLARSDQVEAGNAKPDKDAGALPAGVFNASTVMVGEVPCGFIDYVV